MSYSTDYRKRTIGYRQAGHTPEETHQTFRVSRSTIKMGKTMERGVECGKEASA